ncbi:MAG: sigma 54-interacting transcriptional regulator [Desulfobacter sp.]|nr:MAG: sigma 54-interacting transcriptional regulator [Desulfobacter sp.]
MRFQGGVNTVALPDILGQSPVFTALIDKIKRLADSRSTILLMGETGTGKEVFSRALHAESHRKDKPFIAINCGAIPENLIEAELFGYEKGAFTGADKYGKQGRLYHGNGGTVLLDEVENMPLYMQQKLLRVLETRQVDRIGGTRPVPIDGRFIVATNKNLEDMVARGTFREDLFHRINVITLEIPPLRERGADVIILARHFIRQYNAILGCHIHGMSDRVSEFFMNYQWPGNVRELQNTIEYAMNMETGDEIRFDTLPRRLRHRPKSGSTLEALEREAIREALSRFGRHNEGKERAAAFLGISRSTIYRKIRKYGLG